MPEAKLDVIVDPSGAISGSSRAKQAINSMNDSTRKMATEMEKARQAQERMSAAAQRMVGAIRAAGTAWLVYKGVMNTYIRNSMEAERASTQLDAVLKSTKSAAGLTAVEIKNMASEMQMLTAFGDDEVISMQNLLLTFKQIKGDTFKQATMAVLDLSTAMGTDLSSAAIQVGKALNDPKIGLTALQRVGITFSEEQKKLIKGFTDTGKVAEAQKIILKELEAQFGGSAKAATNTFGGALSQLKNKFGDLFEINATGEFNEMTVAVKELTKTLDTKPVQEFTQELGKLIANGITGATEGLKLMADNVDTLKTALGALMAMKVGSWFGGLQGAIIGGAGYILGKGAYDFVKNDREQAKITMDMLKREQGGYSMTSSAGKSYGGMFADEKAALLGEKVKASGVSTGYSAGGSATGKSGGKTAAEEALERIKLKAQEAGKEIAAAVERLEGRNKMMEEARLAAEEGINRFNEEMAQVATDKAISAIEALKLQVDIGNISFEQYRSGLNQLKSEFVDMPDAITEIDAAMKALDTSILVSTRTMGSFIREAETALRDKLVGIPDALSGAFAGAIAYSEDLGESLKQLAKDIAYTTLKAFILKSIFGGLGGLGGGGTPNTSIFLSPDGGYAKGGVFNSMGVTAFAHGGIVNKPTLFPFASGVGLMGEAGPEAIMPLSRGTDGKLGVKSEGGGGMTNITMNINAVDSRSFVEMMRTNRASVESIVVENIMRNGAVRGAIKGMT